MSKDEVRVKARDIVCQQLGVDADSVTDEATFREDLGADDLDFVELVMEFEGEFGIEIPEEDSEKMTTFGEAVAWLSEKVA